MFVLLCGFMGRGRLISLTNQIQYREVPFISTTV
nr:MAG TPA: hypothetical protein [Caudoviricetes sp.]